MKRFHLFSPLPLVLLVAMPPLVSNGNELYQLRPYQQPPGTVMHILTTSTSSNGTVTITEDETEQKGKVTYRRDRKVERRTGRNEGRASVEYKVVSDITKTAFEVDGATTPYTILSSLTGKTAVGSRDAVGQWTFSIPGTRPTMDQAEELQQIEAYENHHLMPGKPVRLKESWKIEPAFLRHHTERGIGFATIEARARLDQVKEIDGEPTAIITFTVETVATEGGSLEGRGSGATIKAAGEIHVSMKTMLDKKLTLYGKRTTVTVEGGVRSRTVLPIKMEVIKTIGN